MFQHQMFRHKPRQFAIGNRTFLFIGWRVYRTYLLDRTESVYRPGCDYARIGRDIIVMQPLLDSIFHPLNPRK